MLVVAGKFHRRRLVAPKGDKTRPTSARLRETLFNILQQEVEGAAFLDIFAGSGAIGIEALSRGATHATFIEIDREAVRALETNLKNLEATSQASLLVGDFQRMLEKLAKANRQFDIIFADAPYEMQQSSATLLEKVFSKNLLKLGGYLFIEDENPTPPPGYEKECMNSRRSGRAYLHQFRRLN